MTTTVVRYQTKPEWADENQALIEKVFAALAESKPAGLRYSSYRLDDNVTFVHIADVDPFAGDHPLTSTPAFQAFAAGLGERCVEGPNPVSAMLVGTYDGGIN